MACCVDGEFVSCGSLLFLVKLVFQIIKEPLSRTDRDPFTEGKELFQTYITLEKKVIAPKT